jgi:predicted flap endonuclease-1-like 5' DNA nuclease/predicted  nucleic acid-binding Zn-ribbon protein
MRTFLFVILTSVAAVLLWAVWTQSYVDGLVFTLSLSATGLCGYLIADYFFVNEKKTWQLDIGIYKKEISVLKEEIDILQKQMSLAVPYSELDDLRKKYTISEADRNRLNGEFLAQVGNIASLNTRLESLQKEYKKFREESTITSETRLTELEAIRDALSFSKNKLTELAQQNKALKEELNRYQQEVAEINEHNRHLEALGHSTAPTTEHTEGYNPETSRGHSDLVEASEDLVFLSERASDAQLTTHRRHSRSVDDSEVEIIHRLYLEPESHPVEPEEMVLEVSEHSISESSEPEPSPSGNSQPIEGAPEDLKVVEGIGPKIELLLKESGIKGLKDLSIVPVEDLKEILAKGGTRYRLNDPTSWPEQARLLVSGELDKFKSFTSDLFSKKNSK